MVQATLTDEGSLRRGLAANSVRSLTMVLADGEVVEASATHRADLFWARRGGGGGFGVVVEAEIDLIGMHRIVTGMTVWDAARLAPVWPEWTRTAPPGITTSLRVLALDGAATATTASGLPAAQRTVTEMPTPLIVLARPVADTWAVAGPEALPLTHLDPAQPVAFGSDSALINGIDRDGWAAVLDAGPSLLAVEPRQLGGALATPAPTGGVLDHFAAPLLYHAVGVTGPETARDLGAVRSAVRPYLTGFTAPNFVDHVDQPQRTDPTGLFAGDISPIRPERTAS